MDIKSSSVLTRCKTIKSRNIRLYLCYLYLNFLFIIIVFNISRGECEKGLSVYK